MAVEFRDMLLGAHFNVYADTIPLSYMQTATQLGATEMRCTVDLALFSFDVKYRSGRSNGNAYALSRKPQYILSEEHIKTELDITLKLKALPSDLRITTHDARANCPALPEKISPSCRKQTHTGRLWVFRSTVQAKRHLPER